MLRKEYGLSNRREILKASSFLKKYKEVLKPGGVIHLKTDSEFMHGYTIGLLQAREEEIIYAHHDIYSNLEAPEEVVGTQTFYEQQYLEKGKAITYLQFDLKKLP